MGQLGNSRGAWNERRTLAAAQDLRETWPVWLLELRAGTKAEDARGWDLVAVTDVGKIGVQVKSCEAALARHQERRPGVPGIAVGTLEDREAGRQLVLVVTQERARILARRG